MDPHLSPEAAGNTHGAPATSIRVVAPRSASIVRGPPAALQSHLLPPQVGRGRAKESWAHWLAPGRRPKLAEPTSASPRPSAHRLPRTRRPFCARVSVRSRASDTGGLHSLRCRLSDTSFRPETARSRCTLGFREDRV